MAELPVDPSNGHIEQSMPYSEDIAQPGRTNTAVNACAEKDAGPHVAGMDEDTTRHVSNEPPSQDAHTIEISDLDKDITHHVPNESNGQDASAIEGPSSNDAASEAEMDEEPVQTEVKTKKKKRKGKRASKSRKNITGFEEFYADKPMTPAEALETKKIYDPTRPFADRIEECIQRYRASRRLQEVRTVMFNKYLFLGGIDTSQRQFTGMATDRDAMAEADVEQIRSMTATDTVGGGGSRFYDGSDLEGWDVDFEAVAKGFLSRTITDWYMYDSVANQTAADLVKNFLNYIIMHNVCPEYTSNIMAARHICDISPTELRHVHELTRELPGAFNRNARSLFCEGKVNDLEQEENREASAHFFLTSSPWFLGTDVLEANDICINGQPTTIHVVSTVEESYEVLEIERPGLERKKKLNAVLAELAPPCKVTPTGILRVAPTIIAHGWGNVPRPEEVDFSKAEKEEYILEDELLAKFEVGMKIRMTVCKLSNGIRFIKEVHDVRVSFDTFLAQHLMNRWKDPVPNDRPAPSVHNPNVEENMMDAEMQADADADEKLMNVEMGTETKAGD